MAKQLINLSPSDQVALSSDIQRKADWFMYHGTGTGSSGFYYSVTTSVPVTVTLRPYELAHVYVPTGVVGSVSVEFAIGDRDVNGLYEYMMLIDCRSGSSLSLTWPAFGSGGSTLAVSPRTSADVDLVCDPGFNMYFMQEFVATGAATRRVIVSRVPFSLVSST